MPDQDGLRLLLESARARLSRLKHLWLDAGYEGRGRGWAEKGMGWSVEVVRRPPKPIPEKVAQIWAEKSAKEDKQVEWERLMSQRGAPEMPTSFVDTAFAATFGLSILLIFVGNLLLGIAVARRRYPSCSSAEPAREPPREDAVSQ